MVGVINFAYNSPVDFTRTQIKLMPPSTQTRQVFNHMCPDDQMPQSSQSKMQNLLVALEFEGSDANSDNTVNILSGMTLGSSFVGMVHILKNESTSASQTNQLVNGEDGNHHEARRMIQQHERWLWRRRDVCEQRQGAAIHT